MNSTTAIVAQWGQQMAPSQSETTSKSSQRAPVSIQEIDLEMTSPVRRSTLYSDHSIGSLASPMDPSRRQSVFLCNLTERELARIRERESIESITDIEENNIIFDRVMEVEQRSRKFAEELQNMRKVLEDTNAKLELKEFQAEEMIAKNQRTFTQLQNELRTNELLRVRVTSLQDQNEKLLRVSALYSEEMADEKIKHEEIVNNLMQQIEHLKEECHSSSFSNIHSSIPENNQVNLEDLVRAYEAQIKSMTVHLESLESTVAGQEETITMKDQLIVDLQESCQRSSFLIEMQSNNENTLIPFYQGEFNRIKEQFSTESSQQLKKIAQLNNVVQIKEEKLEQMRKQLAQIMQKLNVVQGAIANEKMTKTSEVTMLESKLNEAKDQLRQAKQQVIKMNKSQGKLKSERLLIMSSYRSNTSDQSMQQTSHNISCNTMKSIMDESSSREYNTFPAQQHRVQEESTENSVDSDTNQIVINLTDNNSKVTMKYEDPTFKIKGSPLKKKRGPSHLLDQKNQFEIVSNVVDIQIMLKPSMILKIGSTSLKDDKSAVRMGKAEKRDQEQSIQGVSSEGVVNGVALDKGKNKQQQQQNLNNNNNNNNQGHWGDMGNQDDLLKHLNDSSQQGKGNQKELNNDNQQEYNNNSQQQQNNNSQQKYNNNSQQEYNNGNQQKYNNDNTQLQNNSSKQSQNNDNTQFQNNHRQQQQNNGDSTNNNSGYKNEFLNTPSNPSICKQIEQHIRSPSQMNDNGGKSQQLDVQDKQKVQSPINSIEMLPLCSNQCLPPPYLFTPIEPAPIISYVSAQKRMIADRNKIEERIDEEQDQRGDSQNGQGPNNDQQQFDNSNDQMRAGIDRRMQLSPLHHENMQQESQSNGQQDLPAMTSFKVFPQDGNHKQLTVIDEESDYIGSCSLASNKKMTSLPFIGFLRERGTQWEEEVGGMEANILDKAHSNKGIQFRSSSSKNINPNSNNEPYTTNSIKNSTPSSCQTIGSMSSINSRQQSQQAIKEISAHAKHKKSRNFVLSQPISLLNAPTVLPCIMESNLQSQVTFRNNANSQIVTMANGAIAQKIIQTMHKYESIININHQMIEQLQERVFEHVKDSLEKDIKLMAMAKDKERLEKTISNLQDKVSQIVQQGEYREFEIYRWMQHAFQLDVMVKSRLRGVENRWQANRSAVNFLSKKLGLCQMKLSRITGSSSSIVSSRPPFSQLQ